ncbi:MAG TPA: hypothetical protein VK363_11975 [Pyrinomonadaceae bacterium]|nr:hypothetical protein [Pyrinomonadaceae bacterium]
MMKHLTSATLALLAFTAPGFAQQQQGAPHNRTPAPPLNEQSQQAGDSQTIVFVGGVPVSDELPLLNLPPEEGAWAIQIVTRGGILNHVKSVLNISSQGDLTADESALSRRATLAPALLRKIDRLIASGKIDPGGSPLVSFCRDCYVTTLTLHRRVAGGFAQTHTASWDDTTARRDLRGDVAKIYRHVLTLKQRALDGRKK